MTTAWNEQRFYAARASFRRRLIPRVAALSAGLIAVGALLPLLLGGGVLWFVPGAMVGFAFTVYSFLDELAPEHMRRRQRGLLGERETRKVLQELEREGWRVRHGVDVGRGDLDHVLTGPNGVFILDTKALLGEIRVERGVLVTCQKDDPDEIWRWRGLARRMSSLGIEVSKWIRSDAALRTWVQPVVVIWGNFPQRLVEVNRVAYIHGDDLVEWLRSRPTRRDEIDFDEPT